jgi:hypothetical protein
MKIIQIFIAIVIFLVASVNSVQSLATDSPFSTPRTRNFQISLFSKADRIEISEIPEHRPECVTLNYVPEQRGIVKIASFLQEGDANAKITSVFKLSNKPHLLGVIVKWHYYLSGVNTEGDYYEVHTYQGLRSSDGMITFREINILSESIASGFEGRREGKIVHFSLKDAASVREKLNDRSVR